MITNHMRTGTRKREERTMSAFDFTFVSIDGAPLPLKDFAGRPILLVDQQGEEGVHRWAPL
jgi:hypothetical protein